MLKVIQYCRLYLFYLISSVHFNNEPEYEDNKAVLDHPRRKLLIGENEKKRNERERRVRGEGGERGTNEKNVYRDRPGHFSCNFIL